jgi:nucleoside-diphosphate-sugar epimerase
VRGDLHDQRTLTDLVADATVVVHAAGLVRSTDESALWRANVDGLIALLDACDSVDRVVHLSTAGVHGLPGGVVDEETPFAPANPYEASKVAAERALFRRRPTGAVAVRPTNILGVGHPRDPLRRFFAAVASGSVWTWRGAWSNYVAVDAVANAVVAAASSERPPLTLFVNEAEPVIGLARRVASLLGVADRTHLVPARVAQALRRPVAATARHVSGLQRVASALETTRFESLRGPWLEANGVTPNLEPTLRAMIEDYQRRELL